MLEIERVVRQQWADAKLYEQDAPSRQEGKEAKPKEKFMCTFPYPYMNGVLHLGHAFSLSKAEFTARYQRLRGKQVLFPFGFHCTGMPIAACADRIKREIQLYGNPPQFPVDEAKEGDDKEVDVPEQPEKDAKENKEADAAKKKKGGKVLSLCIYVVFIVLHDVSTCMNALRISICLPNRQHGRSSARFPQFLLFFY